MLTFARSLPNVTKLMLVLGLIVFAGVAIVEAAGSVNASTTLSKSGSGVRCGGSSSASGGAITSHTVTTYCYADGVLVSIPTNSCGSFSFCSKTKTLFPGTGCKYWQATTVGSAYIGGVYTVGVDSDQGYICI